MNTVIVTGAKGALGSVVCDVLRSRGWVVAEIDTKDGDVTKSEDVERLVANSPPRPSGAPANSPPRPSGAPANSPPRPSPAERGAVTACVQLVGGIEAGKALENTSLDVLQRMFSLNVYPTYNLAKALLPLWKVQGGGSFVTMGAQSVIHPVENRAAYSAAKSANVSLVQSIAEEGRPYNIRANAILPSILRTKANLEWASEEEAKNWPTPEEVAEVIAFLIDPKCTVTGAVIPMFGKIAV